MSELERMHFLGFSHQRGRVMNTLQQPEEAVKLTAINDLPTSVDWRDKNVVTSVKDQGSCGKEVIILFLIAFFLKNNFKNRIYLLSGSCWAIAATQAIESFAAIKSGTLYDLSSEQVLINVSLCIG